MPDVFYQQRASEPAGEQEGERGGDGGGNERKQCAEPRAEGYTADEHEYAAGQQADRGENEQGDVDGVAERAALVYERLQVTDVGDQFSQAESVGQDNQEADDSDDEQELSGCGVVTSFA